MKKFINKIMKIIFVVLFATLLLSCSVTKPEYNWYASKWNYQRFKFSDSTFAYNNSSGIEKYSYGTYRKINKNTLVIDSYIKDIRNIPVKVIEETDSTREEIIIDYYINDMLGNARLWKKCQDNIGNIFYFIVNDTMILKSCSPEVKINKKIKVKSIKVKIAINQKMGRNWTPRFNEWETKTYFLKNNQSNLIKIYSPTNAYISNYYPIRNDTIYLKHNAIINKGIKYNKKDNKMFNNLSF